MPLSKKKEKFGKNKVINSTVEASKIKYLIEQYYSLINSI
jgi:hypothetical protein